MWNLFEPNFYFRFMFDYSAKPLSHKDPKFLAIYWYDETNLGTTLNFLSEMLKKLSSVFLDKTFLK